MSLVRSQPIPQGIPRWSIPSASHPAAARKSVPSGKRLAPRGYPRLGSIPRLHDSLRGVCLPRDPNRSLKHNALHSLCGSFPARLSIGLQGPGPGGGLLSSCGSKAQGSFVAKRYRHLFQEQAGASLLWVRFPPPRKGQALATSLRNLFTLSQQGFGFLRFVSAWSLVRVQLSRPSTGR
jgi:hypothetical protein